jgi:hypothetical protein
LETKGKDLQGVVMQFGLDKETTLHSVGSASWSWKGRTLHSIGSAIWSWKERKDLHLSAVQCSLGSNQRKGKSIYQCAMTLFCKHRRKSLGIITCNSTSNAWY